MASAQVLLWAFHQICELDQYYDNDEGKDVCKMYFDNNGSSRCFNRHNRLCLGYVKKMII